MPPSCCSGVENGKNGLLMQAGKIIYIERFFLGLL